MNHQERKSTYRHIMTHVCSSHQKIQCQANQDLSTVENSGESIENPVEFAHFTPLTNNEGKDKFDGEGASREKDNPMRDKPVSCDNEEQLSENTAVESDNLVSDTDSRNTPDKSNDN